MLHLMPAPFVVIHISEAHVQVELLGPRVACINQQACWKPHLPPFLYGGLEKAGGNALIPEGLADAERVDIQLASLRLIGHGGIVAPEGRQCPSDERQPQLMEQSPVITDADACHLPFLGDGCERVAIGVLGVVPSDQAGHQPVEIVQRVFRSCKPLATLVVHRLHDEPCNLCGLLFPCLFNRNHSAKIGKESDEQGIFTNIMKIEK